MHKDSKQEYHPSTTTEAESFHVQQKPRSDQNVGDHVVHFYHPNKLSLSTSGKMDLVESRNKNPAVVSPYSSGSIYENWSYSIGSLVFLVAHIRRISPNYDHHLHANLTFQEERQARFEHLQRHMLEMTLEMTDVWPMGCW